jgi:YD repeat-containing protein
MYKEMYKGRIGDRQKTAYKEHIKGQTFRREESYRADGAIEKIVQPDGTEILFGHDQYKRRESVTDPMGNVTRFEPELRS